MKKQLFWISIICTVFAVLNLIPYTVLACMDFVEMRWLSYMFIFGFVVCSWIPFFLNWIFKLQFNIIIIICYQVFLALSLIVGSLWRVYGMWGIYDSIVHFGSGVLISMITYSLFENCNKNNKLSLVWLFVLVFSVGVMCAGVWEIYEFVTDGIIGNNAQVFEGLVGREALRDTMTDIICGTCGSILGAVVVVLIERQKRRKEKVVEDIKN